MSDLSDRALVVVLVCAALLWPILWAADRMATRICARLDAARTAQQQARTQARQTHPAVRRRRTDGSWGHGVWVMMHTHTVSAQPMWPAPPPPPLPPRATANDGVWAAFLDSHPELATTSDVPPDPPEGSNT